MIFLEGAGFGTDGASRVVLIGTTPVLPSTWHESQVSAQVPMTILHGRRYPVGLARMVNGQAVPISNLVDYLLKITFQFTDPDNQVKAGASLRVYTFQDFRWAGQTVVIRRTPARLEFSGYSVNHSLYFAVTVPSLPPGPASLWIEDNGQVVSERKPITILPPF